jgi:Contractile injection system spike tip protein
VSDFVLATGDTVAVTFPTTVIPAAQAPQPLVGTSSDLAFGGAPVCLEGDELPPVLRAPLNYSEPKYPIPGTGTLRFVLTKAVNTTTVLADGGKAVLLKGAPFAAIFTVTTPAVDAKGNPDSQPTKNGTASFTTTNACFTAD